MPKRGLRHPGWPAPSEIDSSQRIDWQNPLSHGLVQAYFPSLGQQEVIRGDRLYSPYPIENITDPQVASTWRLRGDSYGDYFYDTLRVGCNSPKTIAMWVRGNDYGPGSYMAVISSRTNGGPDGGAGYIFILRGGDLTYAHTGASGASAALVTETGKLYFVACTTQANGTGVVLYVDGQQVASGSAGTGTNESTATFYIGQQAGSFSDGWQGPTFIWNRPLSPSEIWQLYAPQTRWSLLRGRSTKRWFTSAPTPSTTGFRLINGRMHRPGSLVA